MLSLRAIAEAGEENVILTPGGTVIILTNTKNMDFQTYQHSNPLAS
jgi:hypothetical protein